MGTISFLLPDPLPPDQARELERACIVGGPDVMPWPSEVRVADGRLSLRRTVEESGYLVAPWRVPGIGLVMGSSATLMEREPAYHLLVELARGKVNQVRCQLSDWRAGGLQVSPELEKIIRDAGRAFGKAVMQPPSGNPNRVAQTALDLSYTAARQLVESYYDQVFQIRHQRQPRLDTTLGCRLRVDPPQGQAATALGWACNSICLPFTWTDVEPSEATFDWQPQDALLQWAVDQGFHVCGGPLIDFAPSLLPRWLKTWERDLSGLARHMGRYVETVVKRYRGRIRRWQLTSAGNWANPLGMSEDELLWLTVRLAEVARQVDPGLELSIGIAQPWGEYMATQDRMHSPFIFADTLIRSGLHLASIDLELVMGVSPRGSYCRDLLETSRLLDLYSLLGTPLRVTLGYPSEMGKDPLADPSLRVDAGHWQDGSTLDTQAAWTAAFAALTLSKPYVQGVTWIHFSDSEPHLFPHCGLVSASGKPKPALEQLHALRELHLR